MSSLLSIEERRVIAKLCKSNGFCLKEVKEGPTSLLQALSLSIFHDDKQDINLKNQLQSFYSQNSNSLSPTFKYSGGHLVEECLRSQNSLPAERQILELFANLFKVHVKLFKVVDEDLVCNTFYKRTVRTVRLLKLTDCAYAAVFPLAFQETLVQMRRLAWNIVDDFLEKPEGAIESCAQGAQQLSQHKLNWLGSEVYEQYIANAVKEFQINYFSKLHSDTLNKSEVSEFVEDYLDAQVEEELTMILAAHRKKRIERRSRRPSPQNLQTQPFSRDNLLSDNQLENETKHVIRK